MKNEFKKKKKRHNDGVTVDFENDLSLKKKQQKKEKKNKAIEEIENYFQI